MSNLYNISLINKIFENNILWFPLIILNIRTITSILINNLTTYQNILSVIINNNVISYSEIIKIGIDIDTRLTFNYYSLAILKPIHTVLYPYNYYYFLSPPTRLNVMYHLCNPFYYSKYKLTLLLWHTLILYDEIQYSAIIYAYNISYKQLFQYIFKYSE